MKIYFSKKFNKAYSKLIKKQQKKVDQTIFIFKDDPNNPKLKNHQLKGNYRGLRSISAAYDLRIIFKVKGKYIEIIFLDVGSHSKVY
jgi:addiction module RelE/StbE family toxin